MIIQNKKIVILSNLIGTKMQQNIFTLSPLDGRYAAKLNSLTSIMNEKNYLQKRIQVEITWLLALSKSGLEGFEPLSENAQQYLFNIVSNFSDKDALEIKEIEKTTNHDVKAVEYWLKSKFENDPELVAIKELIHVACTSEDINNCSHALQIKEAKEKELLPKLNQIIEILENMSYDLSNVAMISRTHGQSATPTTMGKEMANFAIRLKNAKKDIEAIKILAKINGAVGNYNAHVIGWPEFDWENFCKNVVEDSAPWGLGLNFQPYSTQIEQHDYMAQIFDSIARTNTILIDLCRDIWGYVSLGYFIQSVKRGEIGSSTMPHKVNPIDFENAEGNFGLANAILRHLSEKLPISRWQRDLSDSTVIRNIGVAFGYTIVAYDSLNQGLKKLKIETSVIEKDLEDSWELLAEPIQTVMRKFKIPNAYEKLKEITRGKQVSKETLHKLIVSLDIPEIDKKNLLNLTPKNYIGKASELAKRVKS